MRAKYHESDPFASASFEDLRRFMLESREEPPVSFEDYERELHRRVQAWEAEDEEVVDFLKVVTVTSLLSMGPAAAQDAGDAWAPDRG